MDKVGWVDVLSSRAKLTGPSRGGNAAGVHASSHKVPGDIGGLPKQILVVRGEALRAVDKLPDLKSG